MHYTITKKITPRAVSPSYITRLIGLMVILIAIPVIAIALLSFLVYAVFNFIYSHLRSLFTKKKAALPATLFHVERELLNNQHIKIIVVEDEADTELTELNETWMEEVGGSEIYFYRAKTTPLIPILEGNIICFFLKEQAGGVFLQIKNKTRNELLPSTDLIFLLYNTLEIIHVDTIGPFCLYNDEKTTT